MKVVVIGASGLVGGNCLSYLKNETDWEVIGAHLTLQTNDTKYFNASDIDDPNNFNVKQFNPEVIIHCAALSWVDYCEQHPDESYEKSVVPARNMIQLAKDLDAKLVFISTDYLFDGKSGPYNENDETNPLNIYGKHKLLVEEEIESNLTDYLICRITNVFGKELRGKNFIARLINEISDGVKSFSLPADQFATPVYAYDVARAVKLLLEQGKNGIYHLANGEYLSRYGIADIVLSSFPQHQIELKKITTAEMKVTTPRPLKGGLKADKFLSEFPGFKFVSVKEYITSLEKS